MRWFYLALFLFLAACGGCGDTVPENSEDLIVARAQQVLLASDLALTARERDFVLKERPEMLFYNAFGRCSPEKIYSILWRMPGATIQVHGFGNVYEQDDAEVKRVITDFGANGGG